MQKEELHKKLDLLLINPSKNILKDFQKELLKIVEALPACPRCGSTEVNRKGTNATRKIGRVQQFVCKKCNHIYTHNERGYKTSFCLYYQRNSVRMEALESPKKITGSGFSKKVNRIAKALTDINIFKIFQPEISPIHPEPININTINYY